MLWKFSKLEGRLKTYVLMVVLAITAILAIATVEPAPSGPVTRANLIAAKVPVKSDMIRVVR
jgi:Tfp pilus assembly protein PilE